MPIPSLSAHARFEIIKANGLAFAYLDYGDSDKPPVILLHAGGLHKELWDPIARDLCHYYRVLVMDQRGHGDTHKPIDDYHWQRFGDDLVAFVEALGLDEVLVVGHSSGGTATILATSSRPDLFGRAILVEPAIPSLGESDLRNSSRRIAYRARRRRSSFPSTDIFFEYFRSRHRFRLWTDETLWLHAFYGTHMGLDGMLHLKCPPSIEASIIENNQSVDAWAALSNMRCPTLLVTSNDWSTEVVERVRNSMNDITHVKLEGTTHFLPFEEPEAFVNVILDFAWDNGKKE